MVIYSEITGETYETVDECLGAEHKYKKELEEAEKAKKEHEKALDEAYQRAINACNEYLELAGVKFEEKEVEKEEESTDFDEWLIQKMIDFFEL